MRKLLLLVGAVVFVDTLFFSALTPLLPAYAERLDLSKTGAGVLASAYAAGALVGALPGGITAARLGVRPTVLIGLAGMSVTTLVFGLAEHVVVLDSARFLQGLSSSFTWTAALAWLVAAAPPDRRGELIGLAMGAAIGGALLGPVLGGVASVIGTEWAFGAVTVLGSVLALWAWRTPAFPPGERQPVAALFHALSEPRVVAGVWLVALPALLFGVLGVLAPLRLDELGHGAVAISATFLVAAAGEALLTPLLGRVSDRRGRLLPLRGGLIASAVVATALPWVGSRWILTGVVVAAGLAFGAFWSPALSFLADTSEALGLDHAYAFALVNLAWAPGAAVGAAAGGAVAHATVDAFPYLTLAGACLATLAALARLRVGESGPPLTARG
jgi:predicted MFS family arabinose efflux permease